MITKVLVSGILTILYSASMFGWGRMFETVIGFRLPWPLTLIHGLAVLLALGGVLNLVGIAYSETLDAIVVLGLGLAVLLPWLALKSSAIDVKSLMPSAQELRAWAIPALFIITVFAFIDTTQVPPSAFNFHDDFEKYLTFPVRMLATGTLQAGPFSALGGQTLGGQAFLQGFVLAHWPLGTVNAVDALFALTMCLLLATSTMWKVGMPAWLLPIAPILVVVINPQYVNISALYTGAALYMALLVIPWSVRGHSPSLPAASVGIIYAGMVAIKTTFLLPVVIHFLLASLVIAWSTRRLWSTIVWCAQVGATSLLFIAPWLGVHFSVWRGLWSASAPLGDVTESTVVAVPAAQDLNLFSLDPIFYGFGASQAHYTGAILVIVICTLFILALFRYSKAYDSGSSVPWLFVSGTVLIFNFLAFNIVLNGYIGRELALRYICPIIIAGLPAIIAATFFALSRYNGNIYRTKILKRITIVMVLGIVGAFLPSTAARVQQAVRFGNTLSFSAKASRPAYLNYNRYVFSPSAVAAVKSLQIQVPEGEPLLAWMSFPFHLDFARNPVFDVQPGGLSTPWMDFPLSQNPEATSNYLRLKEIKYVAWQYSGFAVRSEASLSSAQSWAGNPRFLQDTHDLQRTLQFNQALVELIKISEVIIDNGAIVLFRIPE